MQTNTFHHRKKKSIRIIKRTGKKAKEAEITRLNNGIRLECKQEIEKQIAEKYNGFSVPQNTVSEIVEKYGIDCVQFVLANTIVRGMEGRSVSLRNKEWASSILTEGEWSNTLILKTPTQLFWMDLQTKSETCSMKRTGSTGTAYTGWPSLHSD